MTEMTPARGARVNAIGLAQADYKGLPSTLGQGCGHNSIANARQNADLFWACLLYTSRCV